MELTSLRILKHAKENSYAIPAFNINSVDWIVAGLISAQKEDSPIILAASDRLADYLGGFLIVRKMLEAYYESLGITVPVVLHLDHARSYERCKDAIDAGFSSVMIDGSSLPIDQNIAMTKKVVAYATEHNVTVEAEVGCVGGSEDGFNSGIIYADTDECADLVNQTGVDALAAAFGSVHGIYVGEPKLSFEKMEEVGKLVDVPLVLHGASGIPDYQIKKAIELGHAKINVNTGCNQAWIKKVRENLDEFPNTHEPRVVLETARDELMNFMISKIREFGSNGRAKEVI